MQPITITQTPATSALIANSQSPGAGAITLNATAASIDSAVGGRILGIVSGGNDSGITFTITGIDNNGLAASETITGANTSTAVSTKFYKSVSSITHTGSVASTMNVTTVQTVLSTSSIIVPLDVYQRVPSEISVQVTGTINFTVLETFDPLLLDSSGVTVSPSAAIYQSITALAAKTSTTHGQCDVGATGLLFQINSYSNGATLVARVISPSNSTFI